MLRPSGGESEATARLSVGSYWFPEIVNEITLDPRPASLGTNVQSRNRSPPVELSNSHRSPEGGGRSTLSSPTDHPHITFPAPRRGGARLLDQAQRERIA